ncbi:hypothetical protein CLOSTHATH_03333 [Hungatella hathewayi DSM 13479]|uniref:Uncharacterized protein n=1 Tax=Hungatella hathewayi DSM 13479 TaxID=566550 RepID=D3AI93_9FIRM|nr:hypothetical protein CLOSTHATH_03333 [Hungatella hathewayi DSM 13479]RHB76226.1 hypothetical protein DW876_03775 [Hungatella hathewayi]
MFRQERRRAGKDFFCPECRTFHLAGEGAFVSWGTNDAGMMIWPYSLQETNGLLYADRTPKLDVERIAACMAGKEKQNG